MKNFTKITGLLFLFLVCITTAYSQNLRGEITPTKEWNQFAGINHGDKWSFNAETNKVYHFSFCNDFGGGKSTGDPILKISNQDGNNIHGIANDDYCGKNAYLVWTCKSSGTYFINAFNSENVSTNESILAFKMSEPLSCQTALGKGVVNISSLPFASSPSTTRGTVNDINETTVGSNLEMQNNKGEDIVYIFKPVTEGYVHISMINNSSNVSLNLYEGCPLVGNQNKLLASISGDDDLKICSKVSVGNTYYLIADSKLPTENYFFRNLTISAPDNNPPTSTELISLNNSLNTSNDASSEAKLVLDVDVKSNAVICRWMAQTFPYGSYYEVERSTNGSDFTKIGKVDVLAEASRDMEYHFEDKNIGDHEKYFYRLKLIEPNGSMVFSKSAATIVKENGTAILEVHQDENKQFLAVNYVLSRSSLVTIEIMNEAGEIVKKYQQGLQHRGQYTFPFSAKSNGLPSGKYSVSVWIDDDHYTANVQDVE